jgi:hypothetical protein
MDILKILIFMCWIYFEEKKILEKQESLRKNG